MDTNDITVCKNWDTTPYPYEYECNTVYMLYSNLLHVHTFCACINVVDSVQLQCVSCFDRHIFREILGYIPVVQYINVHAFE